jgi:uncharacterized protein YndB with AHSA1/START domain
MAEAADIQNPEDLELTITRTFNAPRALVFKMWTASEHLAHWFCPPGFTLESVIADFQPGGAWHSHMRSPDGNDYKMGGTYRDITPDQQIVMTHNWFEGHEGPKIETLVTVDFADKEGKTALIFHQSALSSAAVRDSHKEGWTKFLGRLAEHLQQS